MQKAGSLSDGLSTANVVGVHSQHLGLAHTGTQDPCSNVLVVMPEPDIAGHHGDKNTQTDGMVHTREEVYMGGGAP